MSQESTPAPLDGVIVVELCRYISGPYATRLLADLGATVVKVEDPSSGGDPPRWMAGGQRPYSPQFDSWNRGKRSVCLDLKSPEGLRAMHALLGRSDVFVDNVRPGALDRLSLSDKELADVNPRLVHCSLTGFGPDGPRAADPSYDSIISALSGLYSEMSGHGLVSPSGPSWSDLITGMAGSQAVLAALRARDRDGRGQRVHVSMLNAVLDLLNDAVVTTVETGRPSVFDGRQRRQGILSGVASDGLRFVVQFGERPATWSALIGVLERPELVRDGRFVDYPSRVEHHDELVELVRPILASKPRDHWLDRMADIGIPCAPVNTLDEALRDSQVVATELLDCDGSAGSVPSTRPPARIVPAAVGRPGSAPDLGEHTEEIVGGLGLSAADERTILSAAAAANRPQRSTS